MCPARERSGASGGARRVGSGGVGYRTYGRAGWDRRARVIEFRNQGASVVTWKRLDDEVLTIKDTQTLF